MNKQEMRRAEQERQKKQSRILITVTAVVVVIIFTALFFLAYKDSGANESSGSNVEFNYSELQRLGKEDAPVKIVEFGDFKCPACAQFTGAIKPQIVQDYVDQGKAAFYFVNMTFIGPDSETASLAALSVYHQNNEEFWKYYDALYANQGKEEEEWATVDFLVDLAQQEKLAIDYDLLRKDIQEQTYADELKRHNDLATETNVSSTPTVYVNGSKIADPFNYEAITQEIEKAAEAVSVQ
jgi:protein-disulfide isomerase